MGCRKAWSREVLDSILLTTWINGDYKKHRENILLDREKSRLPAAQLMVGLRKRAKELQPVKAQILTEIKEMEKRIAELRDTYLTVERRIQSLMRGQAPEEQTAEKKEEKEHRVFIMPCPAADCRGFLSTAYKCGVCDIYVCPDCREVKGADRDTPHTCDENTKATVEKLKKETKPCPECGAGIFKIEGCFRMDTPIRLWNGNVKMSQHITVGDELIGDDGNKRTVLSLVQGEDKLYEIKQTNGESYVVNSKHTLVLKYSGDRTIHWSNSQNLWKVQWFDREAKLGRTKNFKVSDHKSKDAALQIAKEFVATLTFPEEIELTIDEYNKLDKWSKRCMMGYKSSNGANYESHTVDLDPYLLGLWLGDGTQNLPIIASNDIEIQQYLLNWCLHNDAELVHDEGVKFRICRRGGTNHKNASRNAIGNGSNCDSCIGCKYKKMDICNSALCYTSAELSNTTDTSDSSNPFTNLLKTYNLINNKHIPKEYLMNSREVRLKVLAGLIDTDGHVPTNQNGKRAVIIQSECNLVKDIEFLVRSLGFVVNITKTERKNVSIFGNEPKDFKDIYHINISGEKLHEIPTMLPRKKCVASAPNKDYHRTSIEVVFKEFGNYYGWSVDGNKRFLHNDFTVLRNCDQMYCTACNTPFSWRTGMKVTNGVIHNPHYFEFLRKSNGGVMPRNPGDIPCITNLPGAWTFEREFMRKYDMTGNKECMALYQALNVITHIQHVEIPHNTNRAEDTDNTELNVRYLLQELDEKTWKQQLQQKEKKRIKKDDLRMRFEAFVGACVDIYGTLMNTTRDVHSVKSIFKIYEDKKKKTVKLCQDAYKNLLAMRTIFNESMMDISKRYKCQVLQIGDDFRRSSKKATTGAKRTKKATKKADDSDSDSSDTEVESVEPKNTIVKTA
jgi:hypothetical protein